MKKIIFLLVAISAMMFIVSCDENNSTGPNESFMDIGPADAKDLIDNNSDLIIIDVSNAWEDGHIPGAINYPWGDGSFEAAVSNWDDEAMYLIYCHGDAPAMAAAQHLADEGFENVYRLEGNYGAWVDAGYEIEIPSYMDISPMDALYLISNNPELMIIDVSNAWAEGHIPGAMNYPWGDGSFEAAVPEWDSNAMFLIYCHGDAPAMAAAQHLIDQGFDNVYRLEGNYGAWVNAGYDIEVGPYMDIAPMGALDLINNNPGIFIIDVSNMWEYGHLPGALDVPLGDGSFENAMSSWDPNEMYLIYCHGDAPSMQAAQMLVDADFTNVYRLEGNYGAWVNAGYDIEVETYRDISAEELYQMMMDDPSLIVIDVSPIYAQGHIPGAVNYYVGDGSLANAIPMLDPMGNYAVYCHTDSASMQGAQMLIDADFIHVYRLAGNFQAWIDAGYPVDP